MNTPIPSSECSTRTPALRLFAGPDVYSTVLESPFADCFGQVTSHPHLFYWHTWPDEPLIHGNAQKDDALSLLAAQTKRHLTGDDFWAFIDRLRQGRRLVITADHGYAKLRQELADGIPSLRRINR